MNVRILRVETEELVDATIRPQKLRLPGLMDGWNFSFDKLSKKPNTTTYVLVTDETPQVIEGCMIFEMKDKEVPYMAYLEVAPQNFSKKKVYDYVAGCLIAFAYKQTFIMAKGDYQGLLHFEVSQQDPADQKKLMTWYCRKYGALKSAFDDKLMYIADQAGEALIKKYLENGEAPSVEKE